MTVQAQENEALTNAMQNVSCANYPAIFAGFLEKGIAEVDIRPRENVFTFKAWRALGRQVCKGEHGVNGNPTGVPRQSPCFMSRRRR